MACRKLAAVAVVCGTLVSLAAARNADAHTIGISRGDYLIVGPVVSAELVFARQELAVSLPELDRDRDGTISLSELTTGRARLDQVFVQRLEVSTPSGRCVGSLRSVDLTDGDGASLSASYRCLTAVDGIVTFDPQFLSALTRGHRHLATMTAGPAIVHAAAYQEHARFQIAARSLRGWASECTVRARGDSDPPRAAGLVDRAHARQRTPTIGRCEPRWLHRLRARSA